MPSIQTWDIVLGAVLLFAVIIGAARGLYRSIAGLLVLVLALTGASRCAAAAAPAVTELLRPQIEANISERVHTAIEAKGSALPETDEAFQKAEALLERFGWQGDLRQTVDEQADAALASAEQSIAATLADSFLSGFVTSLLRILFFVILFAALLLLSRLLSPLFEKLPVIRSFNRLGGGMVGLLFGLLACYIALRVIGTDILPADDGSFLYRLFMRL